MPDTDTVKQLDALLGNDPTHLTIQSIDGTERVIPLEQFSNYKTAQVLKMLASVKDKVDIVQLLQEIITLSQPTITEILLCPHCQKPYSPQEDESIGKDDGLGEHIGCNKCGLPYYLKDAVHRSIDNSNAQVAKVNAIFSAIPKVLEFAPDLLMDFAAFAIITNKELETAYPNGVIALRDANRKWLDLHCDAGVTLRILSAYIPFIGIDFLTKEMSRIDKTVSRLIQSVTGQ